MLEREFVAMVREIREWIGMLDWREWVCGTLCLLLLYALLVGLIIMYQ